jgi:hypothetical protein
LACESAEAATDFTAALVFELLSSFEALVATFGLVCSFVGFLAMDAPSQGGEPSSTEKLTAASPEVCAPGGQMSETSEGKRRPTNDDLAELIFLIAEGKSLRASCVLLGLDPPSTHTWLDTDDDRRQQYARAREMRAEVQAELGFEIGVAAATGRAIEIDGEMTKVDPTGARVALDAIKWSTARMAPKTAPTKKVSINHTFEGSDEDLDAEIARLSDELDEGDDEAPAEA